MSGAGRGTGFYDAMYGGFAEELYASIRAETFGEDVGQNSWTTADELRGFCRWLELDESSEVLEVASGSGGPALHVAAEFGCRVTGIELHDDGVAAANAMAEARGLSDRVRFLRADATERLPFADAEFDAVMCVDAMNHLYNRGEVLREWHRIVKPGGRILFTDPITVTGLLRRDEILARSGMMGEFVFTPPGLDEQLILDAGFVDVRVEDRTENPARVAAAWHAARERRARELDEIEGAEANASFQRLMSAVASLARERRLSRFAYRATRAS